MPIKGRFYRNWDLEARMFAAQSRMAYQPHRSIGHTGEVIGTIAYDPEKGDFKVTLTTKKEDKKLEAPDEQ